MDGRLAWLAVGAFATSTMAFAFAGLLPLISAAAGVSISEAGHLVAIYSLAYAVGTPILATLTGAADRRLVLTGALVVFLVGVLLAAASWSFAGLGAAQVIMGAAAGLFAATAQATAVALAGPEHRARAVAAVVAGTTFAVALGAPLGSLIGAVAGWRATFLFVGLLAAGCAVVLWLRLPRGMPGVRLGIGERLLVIARPGVAPVLAVTFLCLTGAFVVISYLAPLAIDGAGLPPAALPVLLLGFGAGAVVGNFAGGRLTDRHGGARVAGFALAGSAVICLSIFVIVGLLPPALAGPLLIAIMVPWGVAGWMFPPAQASRLVALAPELAGLTLPLNVSAIYFGIAAGSFIGGQVLRLAPPEELGLVGAGALLAALAVLAGSGRRAAVPAGR